MYAQTKKIGRWLLLWSIAIGYIASVQAQERIALDTILTQTMHQAERYSQEVEIYEADVYMKAFIKTTKKNFLYQFTHLIPNFVLHDRKNDSAFVEVYSRFKYETPNNYFQDIKQVQSTLDGRQHIAMLPLRFVGINIYDKATPAETYYLPLRSESRDYYHYQLQSVKKKKNGTVYQIGFAPKFNNPKLLNGHFYVHQTDWRILRFVGKGEDFYSRFEFDLQMGERHTDRLLPTAFDIKQTYQYLGNEVINQHHALLHYDIVGVADGLKKEQYNLGHRYRVRLDSVPINSDTLFWNKTRPIPLQEHEKKMLHHLYQQQKNTPKSDKKEPYALSLAKNMVQNTSYQYKSTRIRYSGLLNPTLIGYSTRDGLAYRQVAHIGINLKRQQRIDINATADIILKRKHFSYQLNSVWNYEPAKLGYLSLAIGRGNPTYSSRFVHLLNDTSYQHATHNSRHLSYYTHHYLQLYNSIELTNGLELGIGIDYHIRQPNAPLIQQSTHKVLYTQYNFVPHINLSWTPHQYYLTDRNQKIYVRSAYPTFKVAYAQSIPNWLQSNSAYSKIELDISQSIRIDLMRRLNYHVGAGQFVNQKNEYFNDFTYFLKSYFPQSWSEGFGGSFSVLPIRYFNSSDYYLQAHLMYETPHLLLTRLPYLNDGVARERLYLSALRNGAFPYYGELGYGIGNKFLNTAIFFGFNGFSYYNLAAKIEFLF